MEKDSKIIGIGLNKTGTTSLHHAFKMLGVKSIHFRDRRGNNIKKKILRNSQDEMPLFSGLEQYTAILDWSLPSTNGLYKTFDVQYPNSKFILTIRDMESWLKSREKHVMRKPNIADLQKQFPDDPWLNVDKQAWIEEYEQHHKDVFDYFEGREDDLLVFDITKGDGWSELCPFLDVPVPTKPFPKSNTSVHPLLYKVKRGLLDISGKLNIKT